MEIMNCEFLESGNRDHNKEYWRNYKELREKLILADQEVEDEFLGCVFSMEYEVKKISYNKGFRDGIKLMTDLMNS